MVDPLDDDGATVCGACGAVIVGADERNFAYASTGEICWDCAKARGGTWDTETEHWSGAPDVGDLLPYDD
jgi:hypothetical protein